LLITGNDSVCLFVLEFLSSEFDPLRPWHSLYEQSTCCCSTSPYPDSLSERAAATHCEHAGQRAEGWLMA